MSKYDNLDIKNIYIDYWDNKKSIEKIALKYNIPLGSVSYIFKMFNIKMRSFKEGIKIWGFKKGHIAWNKNLKGIHLSPNTEFKKGTKTGRIPKTAFKSGVNHPRWKGGITVLYIIIRRLKEYKDWRTEVFKRDNYTCQKCLEKDSVSGKLEAHHNKEFNIIFAEFLQQYSQFSPIEDKETLIRLSISYSPFWDIDNGITLCEHCHKSFTKKKSLYNEL